MNLKTQLRHFLTSLAAVGTYAGTAIYLNPAETQAMNEGGAAMIDPLASVLAVVVAAGVRAVMGWLAGAAKRGGTKG